MWKKNQGTQGCQRMKIKIGVQILYQPWNYQGTCFSIPREGRESFVWRVSHLFYYHYLQRWCRSNRATFRPTLYQYFLLHIIICARSSSFWQDFFIIVLCALLLWRSLLLSCAQHCSCSLIVLYTASSSQRDCCCYSWGRGGGLSWRKTHCASKNSTMARCSFASGATNQPQEQNFIVVILIGITALIDG